MACSTPRLVIVMPASSRPKPKPSAMTTGKALPWLPRSHAAKASRVLVRSDRMHSRSTSSGDMPGPLSVTVITLPSSVIVISGSTPCSSARPLSINSFYGRAEPVVAHAPHPFFELGLGREFEAARERQDRARAHARALGPRRPGDQGRTSVVAAMREMCAR